MYSPRVVLPWSATCLDPINGVGDLPTSHGVPWWKLKRPTWRSPQWPRGDPPIGVPAAQFFGALRCSPPIDDVFIQSTKNITGSTGGHCMAGAQQDYSKRP